MRHPICERLIKSYRSARVWLPARRKFTRSRRYFIIYNRKYRYSRRNDARRIRARTRKRNFSNARARVREKDARSSSYGMIAFFIRVQCIYENYRLFYSNWNVAHNCSSHIYLFMCVNCLQTFLCYFKKERHVQIGSGIFE